MRQSATRHWHEKAALAEALAARTADLQESLAYQTATSDVLKVISRSTCDLQPVLDTLIVSALGLCNASQGEIWRKDGEVFRHADSHGNLPAYREIEERTEIGAGRGTLVGRVALERAQFSSSTPGTTPNTSRRRRCISVSRVRCLAFHCYAMGS